MKCIVDNIYEVKFHEVTVKSGATYQGRLDLQWVGEDEDRSFFAFIRYPNADDKVVISHRQIDTIEPINDRKLYRIDRLGDRSPSATWIEVSEAELAEAISAKPAQSINRHPAPHPSSKRLCDLWIVGRLVPCWARAKGISTRYP